MKVDTDTMALWCSVDFDFDCGEGVLTGCQYCYTTSLESKSVLDQYKKPTSNCERH